MNLKWFLTTTILVMVVIGCEGNALQDDVEVAGEMAVPSAIDADVIPLHNRVIGQMGQFNYDAAVAGYRRLVDAFPQADQFKVDLAIALLNRRQEKDLSESGELLASIFDSSPEVLRAKYCQALLLFHEGKTKEANQLFRSVAEADEEDSYAVFYVGQTEFLLANFETALAQFEEAAQIDPYLRSAYYGAFQAAQRLKQRDKAREYLKLFQKLDTNPRARLAELKYTRMGPKAEVSRPRSETPPPGRPKGSIFAAPAPLEIENFSATDWAGNDASIPSITIADLNSDGHSDLFIPRIAATEEQASTNLVLLGSEDGFRRDVDSPLANVGQVNTALWGDYDDDGLTDAYLCRNGPNQLWRQDPAGEWQNLTEVTRISAGDNKTIDGACYDADHDGDLDYLLVNSDAPFELLNNNRDGTFRAVADEMGIEGDRQGTRLIVADVDRDDDADLILVNEKPPHQVYLNDRLWRYHPASGFEQLKGTPIEAALAVDADVDGQVEIYSFGEKGLQRWQPDEEDQWQAEQLGTQKGEKNAGSATLLMQDFDGDTELEIALQVGSGIQLLDLEGKELESLQHKNLVGPVAARAQLNGPDLIAFSSQGPPLHWAAGEGRFDFALLSLSGKTDKAAEMRSNASGIGVRGAARIGSRWSPVSPWRLHSGPGQSLQPLAIGLAGADEIDYLQLVWPDSVSQTETNLAAGQMHRIAETQRQAGSCPLVFVWDGEQFRFVADILGAGGIGFNLGRGEYYPPRPTESLMLSADSIHPRDGRIVIKLGEPMEEICYFDGVGLSAVDLPEEYQIVLDERFGGTDPQPTGASVIYRSEFLPIHATNNRGEDITTTLASVDRVAAPLRRTDRRFIGLTDPHAITLTFAQPLSELENPVLIFDGWVEYAYSQTAFAAWQAGLEYLEPTIEARDENGQWQMVLERFGYMAGTPRRSSVPIPKHKLPKGATELRISSNMQIYWDRISVVESIHDYQVNLRELQLETAVVQDVGFSQRTLFDQRYSVYSYQDRPPFGDARHPRGFYTSLGEARELVRSTDDAVAIIGPGEEVHLEFAQASKNVPDGHRRFYILQVDGWCKDSDSFTKDSRSVEPLPTRGIPLSEEEQAHRNKLHSEYNTRYRSGW